MNVENLTVAKTKIVGTCPGCKHLRLQAPCPDCGRAVYLCWGCPDATERFTAVAGRCVPCAGKVQ